MSSLFFVGICQQKHDKFLQMRVFKKKDEKDHVDKNATASCLVDTSTACASKFQGGATLSTGARQLLELTPLQPCAEALTS